MRLRAGAQKIAALVLLVCLTGCTGGQDAQTAAQALREAYQTLEAFAAAAEVTADYGTRAYQYTAQFSGDESEGEMTVLTPESIAGTGAAWADGQLSLEYDGVSLETGELSPDGLSPADAMPAVLAACQGGAVVECGWQSLDGAEEECLYLLLENPNQAGGESRVALWAEPEHWNLRRAEIFWEQRRVIALVFSDFTWSGDAPGEADS